MYILDKNKDYYDYVSGLYGVDKTITFDRRGSTLVNEKELLEPYTVNIKKGYHSFYDDNAIFFILEVGYIQYLLKYSDFEFKKIKSNIGLVTEVVDSYKGEIIYIYKNNKHYFEREVSLVHYHPAHHFDWKIRKKNSSCLVYEYDNFSGGKVDIDKLIPNPILRDMSIVTNNIDAEDIWKELSNYISSKGNDKVVEIVNSDIQKIENHGFDKKVSFRNPIKL